MMSSQFSSLASRALAAFGLNLRGLVSFLTSCSAACAATSVGSGSSTAVPRRGRLRAGLPGVVGWAAVSGASVSSIWPEAAGPFALIVSGSSLTRASGFSGRALSSIIGSGLVSIICSKRGVAAVETKSVRREAAERCLRER